MVAGVERPVLVEAVYRDPTHSCRYTLPAWPSGSADELQDRYLTVGTVIACTCGALWRVERMDSLLPTRVESYIRVCREGYDGYQPIRGRFGGKIRVRPS